MYPAPGNIPPMFAWQSYTPALQGATDNAVPTFSTQIGRFFLLPGLLLYNILLVSTTMTKTTTTDQVRVSLPVAAKTLANAVWQGNGRVENATAVANTVLSEVASGNAYMTFRNYVLATNSAVMTYATTNPGIGVLTNTITINATGMYEI